MFCWAILWPSIDFRTLFQRFTISNHSQTVLILVCIHSLLCDVASAGHRFHKILRLFSQVSGMVRQKYLDEIKKLAKYLGFVGCRIPQAVERYQINKLISIKQYITVGSTLSTILGNRFYAHGHVYQKNKGFKAQQARYPTCVVHTSQLSWHKSHPAPAGSMDTSSSYRAGRVRELN